MGEERRIFEYFVVAGLPESPVELNPGAQECGYKNTAPQPPITDICVIFPSSGEQVPENFVCIETTPSGHAADLNHGSIRTPSCYLCYRRGYHKPPLVDIGVLYEGRGERVIVDSHIVKTTPFGRPANVNNASQGIYLTYRRAADNVHSNLLAVTDICVILTNKGETPPHTFYKINKNLNKGMVGSDIFICYKKSMANCNRIAYKPAILDRFPLEDYPDYPLPPNVPIFGLPMGALLECWPAKSLAPGRQFLTFVLTDQNGHRFYGAAVVFYETYPHALSPEQLEKLGVNNADPQHRTGSCSDNSSTNDPAETMTFHANKCICVVSRYPFFVAFRRYLFYLLRMSLGGEYTLPIERYISHLLYEVPFPTSRRPRVLMQIGNETICFDNPEDSPLPLNGANFIDFVKLLGAEHCMYLMLLAMTEQKILIHSLRPWHLTSVAEAMCSLLFPFHWQCPYIPQCPLDLAGVLHAPLPFIAGVDSRYFELYEDPPKDVTCVDLDTNTISQSDVRQKIKIGLLPRKAAKQLRQQLEALEAKVAQAEFHITNARSQHGFVPVEVDLQNIKRRRNLESEIQETFLRFMVQILKGYQQYLKPIRSAPSAGATDLESLFDVNGFLRSRDKSGLDFFKLLTNTQLFIRFIEERSLLSDKDKNAYLAFFDECMAKVENSASGGGGGGSGGGVGGGIGAEHGESTKLLEYEFASQSDDRAVFFAPPEPSSTPEQRLFVYGSTFPKLELENFALDSLISSDAAGHLLRTPKQLAATHHDIATGATAPRRTKQEAKAALRLAKQQKVVAPLSWAKCLLSYGYSLWFTHLPAFVKASSSKQRALRDAYNVLDRMQNADLAPMLDEVCYRILIQVCGVFAQPVMAVKVFLDMKRQHIQPNAITYGFYNRAVLEAQWPSTTTLSAQNYWNKIRLSVRAIALLKRALREKQMRARRTLSQYSTESGDFVSQISLGSQQSAIGGGMTKRSMGDMASAISTTTTEVGTTVGGDDRADLGYHSQATEDSLSVGIDSVPQQQQHHTDFGGSKTLPTTRSSSARLNEWNLAAFDEFYRKGRAIITDPPLRPSLASYDSVAGLLMSSDLSKLDDSVFFDTSTTMGKCGGQQSSSKRYRNRSLIDNPSGGGGRATKSGSKLCYSLSEPEGVVRAKDDDDGKNGDDEDGGQFGADANILKQTSKTAGTEESQTTATSTGDQGNERKPTKLGNIPEEGHIESEDVHPLSSDSSDISEMARRSHSRSPTKSIRTTLTDPCSHPLGFAEEEDVDNNENDRGDTKRDESTTTLLTPAKIQAQKLLLDKQPFEDELRQDKTPGDDSMQNTSGGGSFLGLSNFGRSSVRGFWNRVSNATPISRLSKSHTIDSNLQTPPRGNSPPIPSPTRGAGSIDGGTPTIGDFATPLSSYNPTTANAGTLSPTLSHLVTQGAKMISKVDAGVRSSDSFTRLKAGVTSVVKSFKGNLEQQLGSPMRGSWSSLSLGDAAALGLAPVPIAYGGADDLSSLGDDYGGGLWIHQSATNDDTSSVATATGISAAPQDFDSDPAFQLSSGQTGSLMNSDFVSGRMATAMAVDGVDGHAVGGGSLGDSTSIEVLLCTTSRCDRCAAFLFDEEVMAGWSADESDLNTQCQFCGEKRVPILNVLVRRQCSNPTDSWYSKTSSLNRRDKNKSSAVANNKPASDGGILRRSSFNTQSTADDSIPGGGGGAVDETKSSSMEALPSSPAALDSSSTLSSPPLSSVDEKPFAFESTPKLTTNPTSGGRDRSLLREAVNRRLFMDSLSSPNKPFGSADGTQHDDEEEENRSVAVSVPYLSPFVLRKELETVLSSEGDEALIDIGFIKKHPIIYWNLLYVFRRLAVPTHFVSWIPLEYADKFGLSSPSKSTKDNNNDDQQSTAATTVLFSPSMDVQVTVRCVYDLPLLRQSQQQRQNRRSSSSTINKPIYVALQQQQACNNEEETSSSLMHALLIENRLLVSRTVVKQIIDYLSVPNLHKPIMIMINEHRKRTTSSSSSKGQSYHDLPKHFSIYRDILFLAMTQFGQRGVRRDDFDREYASAFAKLPPSIAAKLAPEDRPPTIMAKVCRKIYIPLDVC